MNYRVALITDNRVRSRTIVDAAPPLLDINVVKLEEGGERVPADYSHVIVDATLCDRHTVETLRKLLGALPPSMPRVFVVDPKNVRDSAQANSLGASRLAPRAKWQEAFHTALTGGSIDEALASAVDRTAEINDSMLDAARRGEPLPSEEIAESANLAMSALRIGGIDVWLKSLRSHHSYTYRHCLAVTSFSTAFALHYGMRDADVQRLAIGGLLHDIGKARIPLDILDKAGPLSEEEMALIRRHPTYGAEILRKHRQFGDEIIDITLHHHEYVDGSGYPDGLKGSEISDMVRIMTIADVFSALIDRRSYKAAMSKAEAMDVLKGMNGKLDPDLLRAFEPVAASVP